MSSTVVVSYEIKPEAKDTHIGLLHAVFEELELRSLEHVEYRVFCLDDGVSFTHISTFNSDDGSNPIVHLEAFKNFNENLSDRLVSPPKVESVNLVGNYTEHK